MFIEEMSKSNNIVSLKKLEQLVLLYSGYSLTYKDKQYIYEVYSSLYDDKGKLINEIFAKPRASLLFEDKIKQLPNSINNKYVMLNKLDAARKQINNKKIQELMDLEEDEIHLAETIKYQGLI